MTLQCAVVGNEICKATKCDLPSGTVCDRTKDNCPSCLIASGSIILCVFKLNGKCDTGATECKVESPFETRFKNGETGTTFGNTAESSKDKTGIYLAIIVSSVVGGGILILAIALAVVYYKTPKASDRKECPLEEIKTPQVLIDTPDELLDFRTSQKDGFTLSTPEELL